MLLRLAGVKGAAKARKKKETDGGKRIEEKSREE